MLLGSFFIMAMLGSGCAVQSTEVKAPTLVPAMSMTETPVSQSPITVLPPRNPSAIAQPSANLTPAALPTGVEFGPDGRPLFPTPPASCPVTYPKLLRPDIAPGSGASPVWMVRGALPAAAWMGPEGLDEIFWLIEDSVKGNVEITGKQLDGNAIARFQYEYDNKSQDPSKLVLGPPHGLNAERSGYIIFPAPGCWQFTAQADAKIITITTWLWSGWPGP